MSGNEKLRQAANSTTVSSWCFGFQPISEALSLSITSFILELEFLPIWGKTSPSLKLEDVVVTGWKMSLLSWIWNFSLVLAGNDNGIGLRIHRLPCMSWSPSSVTLVLSGWIPCLTKSFAELNGPLWLATCPLIAWSRVPWIELPRDCLFGKAVNPGQKREVTLCTLFCFDFCNP